MNGIRCARAALDVPVLCPGGEATGLSRSGTFFEGVRSTSDDSPARQTPLHTLDGLTAHNVGVRTQ